MPPLIPGRPSRPALRLAPRHVARRGRAGLRPGTLVLAVVPALVAVVTILGVVGYGVGLGGAPPADLAGDAAGAGAGRAAALESSPRPTPVATDPAAVGVWRDWEDLRIAAWVAGDTGELAALYRPGSSAGDHDAALLRRYLDRGVRVTAMQRQVLAVEVLRATRHRIRLRVTDRLHHLAVDSAAPAPGGLPTARPITREVRLERLDGRWLMATVR